MSSHHNRRTQLKHYGMEDAAKERRAQAVTSRHLAVEANKQAAKEAGLAIQATLNYWRAASLVFWALSWITALAAINIAILMWYL